jgi:hypothetical protein
MSTHRFFTPLKIVTLVTALTCGAGLRATPITVAPAPAGPDAGQHGFKHAAFRDSAEADQLRNAYRILATGDHDYKGHRAKAMHAVEEAGKPLGMDLAGDLKDRSPQPLSDEKLREAKDLLTQVLESSEVKDQKHVVKHLNEAVHQLQTALIIR